MNWSKINWNLTHNNGSILSPPAETPERMADRLPVLSSHGNEVEEIISVRPPFLVRWGTVVYLLFLVGAGFVCWLIPYPEIISAKAKLSSILAPRQVVARTDGRLSSILVGDNEEVVAGQKVGYMESAADPLMVQQVSRRLTEMSALITSDRTQELYGYHQRLLTSNISTGSLGELQAGYELFYQAFGEYREYLPQGLFHRKFDMLAAGLANLQKQHAILEQRKTLLLQDLAITHETFDSNQSLLKEKAISPLEYRNEKSKLITKQLTIPQVNAELASNENQQINQNKEMAELENQFTVQRQLFIQALNTFSSQIKTWEMKYTLTAPVSGRLTYISFLQENQEIQARQPLFIVQPANSEYFVELVIPQYNFGKIRLGQKVILKFEAYPFEQFGTLSGTILSINPSPTDSGYLAKVALPEGLRTSYGQLLQFRNGLLAQAEIVTEDLRLLTHFYYSMKRQLLHR